MSLGRDNLGAWGLPMTQRILSRPADVAQSSNAGLQCLGITVDSLVVPGIMFSGVILAVLLSATWPRYCLVRIERAGLNSMASARCSMHLDVYAGASQWTHIVNRTCCVWPPRGISSNAGNTGDVASAMLREVCRLRKPLEQGWTACTVIARDCP